MINLTNPLICPSCGHSHAEYPPQGRCAACTADLRPVIRARAEARTTPPDHPLGQVMQTRGCSALIVVLLLSFATTMAVAFLPVGAAIKGLSAACVAFAVAFGAVRYGRDALEATPAGRRSINLLGASFVQMLVYLGASLCALAGVALVSIGLASL
jgi:hypothetical protein